MAVGTQLSDKKKPIRTAGKANICSFSGML